MEKWLNNECKRLEKEGVLEKTNSAWSSPFFTIKNKDGSNRFIMDYRHVNNQLEELRSNIRNPINAINEARKGKWFVKIDLKSAYWKIPTNKKAKEILAFTDYNGQQWTWRAMPFGLKDAPTIFNKYMNEILQGIKNHLGRDEYLLFEWSV